MSEPTFDYPSADSRHVWIKCERDDPQRDKEFWCSASGVWFKHPDQWMCHAGCAQIWRKKVEVPEGYQILGEDEFPQVGDMVLNTALEWKPVVCSYTHSVKQWNGKSGYPYVFIRPIAKPQATVARTFEALNEMVAKAERQANPYAATIEAVTFDRWDVIRALLLLKESQLGISAEWQCKRDALLQKIEGGE